MLGGGGVRLRREFSSPSHTKNESCAIQGAHEIPRAEEYTVPGENDLHVDPLVIFGRARDRSAPDHLTGAVTLPRDDGQVARFDLAVSDEISGDRQTPAPPGPWRVWLPQRRRGPMCGCPRRPKRRDPR